MLQDIRGPVLNIMRSLAIEFELLAEGFLTLGRLLGEFRGSSLGLLLAFLLLLIVIFRIWKLTERVSDTRWVPSGPLIPRVIRACAFVLAEGSRAL